MSIKIQELQEALEGMNSKCASLEKVRHKLIGELDDAQVDVEKVFIGFRVVFSLKVNIFMIQI